MAFVRLLLAVALVVASAQIFASSEWWDRAPGDPPYVDSTLAVGTMTRGLGAEETVVVFFDAPAHDFSGVDELEWAQRGEEVLRRLEARSDALHSSLIRALLSLGVEARSLLMMDAVHARGAPMLIINAALGTEGVAAIVREPVLRSPDPEPEPEPQGGWMGLWEGDYQPSMIDSRANEALDAGYDGAGITIGIIDDGVFYTHESLVENYRGNHDGIFDHNYNWFDPITSSSSPVSSGGHGTHVAGIAVGRGPYNVGIAPGASWVACRGCGDSSCPLTALNACGQFMLAPTDLQGNNADPSLRPEIVNNSWGDCGQSYNPYYASVISAWVAAGQMPVFANGNTVGCGYAAPPPFNTVSNPARYAASFGVGSTSWETQQVVNTSNRGPTDNVNSGSDPLLPNPTGFGDIKPHMSAPGSSIISASISGIGEYELRSGTSMATPAVAGTMAVMKSEVPEIIGNYRAVGTILMQTAVPISVNGDTTTPNNVGGWGRLDVMAALIAAQSLYANSGTVVGVITDSETGEPVEFASVDFVSGFPGLEEIWADTTSASGEYSISLPEGERTLFVFADGYVTKEISDVEIVQGGVVGLNAALTPARNMIEITGRAIDAEGGWPLHAMVTLTTGSGADISFTDPLTGEFSFSAPSDDAFSVSLMALTSTRPNVGESYEAIGFNYSEGLIEDLDLGDLLFVVNSQNCLAPGYGGSDCDFRGPGMLITGQVIDDEKGLPVQEAQVFAEGDAIYSLSGITPDPALGDGVYYAYIPGSSATLVSEPPMALALEPLTTSVSGATGDATVRDFFHGPQKYLVIVQTSGLAGAGEVIDLTLSYDGVDQGVSVSSDGEFPFPHPLRNGTAFTVVKALTAGDIQQECSLNRTDGAIDLADFTDIVVTCTTKRFAVGGWVSGLEGSGLRIAINGQGDFSIDQSGPFAYPIDFPDGTELQLVVTEQPTSPSQVCSVDGDIGVIEGKDYLSLSVFCKTLEFDLSFQVIGDLPSSGILFSNAGESIRVDSEGVFTFPTRIEAGSPYEIRFTSPPTYICDLTEGKTSGKMPESAFSTFILECVERQDTIFRSDFQ